MSWVKLDDNFPDHPKVALLPLRARWVFIQGLCYAARYLTDGLIPEQVANRWEGPQATSALVDAGLWELDESRAFRIHDYLIYNPSRDEMDAKSDANRAAARTRWDKHPASDSASDTHAKRTRGRDGTGSGGSSNGSHSGGVASAKPPYEPAEFVEFYERAYPRREGRGAARKAWATAVGKAAAQDIIAGARRFADDPNRTAGYTPHPSTWLNREGWGDDPLPPRGSDGDDRFARIARDSGAA
jgi:hypothetical protein